TKLLEDAVATAGGGRGPMLMLFDIDRFKTVAATLGRPYAEDILRLASRRLQSEIGGGCVSARVGDDRFACLFPNGTEFDRAGRLAETVRHLMAAPYTVGGRTISSTVTLGIACHPEHGLSGSELMTKAEAALHDAARQGGNIWRVYDPLAAERQLERLTIEDALRSALSNGEFQVCFQPKISIHGRRTVGMEALLRWNSATMGWVSPAVFIPVAEETGLILAIGEHVLRESCTHMKKWLDSGFPEDMKVAVNVSVKQFQHPDLVHSVERILDQTRLHPRSLVLEITESGLVGDAVELAETLGTLRDIGVTLSIDDFGTGYSSLSYLGRLPAHELKIDQSFVRGLPDTVGSQTIVEAIIAIAGSLNLKLVAEGVETEAQLAFLQERGCDVAQGYLFARPLSPADFEAFVRERLRHGKR
ncbi:MAG: bifunctional diguanylate cyclase/phosphodiesterase, partial [Alphaproteobacteria bacterium]|nr:bifunctional diguanylate cyclase/phosphodiesterase [Alphaproteobacteria bacterium]